MDFERIQIYFGAKSKDQQYNNLFAQKRNFAMAHLDQIWEDKRSLTDCWSNRFNEEE